MHEAFIYATNDVLEEIIVSLKRKSKKTPNGLVKDFIRSDRFIRHYASLDPHKTGRPINKSGKYVNLDQSFSRVNKKYFNNAMERPTLTWSARRTYRTMGYYDTLNDILTISRSLDQKSISEEVVDFIMYHELLHKHFGSPSINGRRRAHTAQFRKAEKQFERFDQINLELLQISQKERNKRSRR